MNAGEDGRAANILGAAALAVTDRIAGVLAAAGPASLMPALSALHHFLDGPGLDRICAVLGLTPSGAVRLVDRLESAGLARREAGVDGRSRRVRLTPEGQRLARQISDARLRAASDLLAGLSESEQESLVSLLGRVLANVVASKDGGAWTCRLCNTDACGRDEGLCPSANAASTRYDFAATEVAPPQ
ncbi:MAG: MarR family transcriptional regulator [Actinobacteria bacterium]|nr:MarR family transcriptional regulator [Actinomycetota bacterium]